MNKFFNFSAGPAALPSQVLEKISSDFACASKTKNASVVEISHRSVEFIELAERAERTLTELLSIPKNYKILFLQGGATQQFSMVPINLLGNKKSSNYVNTGRWSIKAIKEAKRYCNVNICTDSGVNGFVDIEDFCNWKIDEKAAYLHYTPNETIDGLEFDYIPELDMPIVADMSSCILSRPIDVSKFGIIYAGAQKNIGVAGLTIVIIRDDLIGNAIKNQPIMFDYLSQSENNSMYNTPCTFAWYVAALVFEWLKDLGGLEEILKVNKIKADMLYKTIDESDFYLNNVVERYRSNMNVVFSLADKNLDKRFIDTAKENGLLAIKGHKIIGGMRASIYNSMTIEGVTALINFMQEFEKIKT